MLLLLLLLLVLLVAPAADERRAGDGAPGPTAPAAAALAVLATLDAATWQHRAFCVGATASESRSAEAQEAPSRRNKLFGGGILVPDAVDCVETRMMEVYTMEVLKGEKGRHKSSKKAKSLHTTGA